jgi:hypothetical protein
MELVNNTPFVPLQFESIDKQLNLFGTTVIRGTFDIQHGKRLLIARDQENPLLVDQYFDKTGESSLRFQTSLVPYKPRTDLLVEATAYAPGGKPSQSWKVGVSVGPINKQFQVTGPRTWKRKLGGYWLSDIEPTKSVEVRYEHAYGGPKSAGDVPNKLAPMNADPCNPIGVGNCIPNGILDIPCPQLLPTGAQDPTFGRPIPVQGLGPLAPAWQPRLQYAGTYDEDWRRTRAPYKPFDFNFLFYNVAPPDQIFPGFASGSEEILLHNLTPQGELSFGLPGIQMIHVIQFEDGRLIPAPINLDTIHVDAEARKVFLEWRGIYPLHIPVKLMEIRLSAPEYLKEA